MSEEAVYAVIEGVPLLMVPPLSGPGRSAPVVIAWHLMDAPRTPEAMAGALPLAGLDAWRIYPTLPLCGTRKPQGGDEEVLRLGYEDAVLNLQGPIADRAAGEFPGLWSALQRELDVDGRALALVGGSMGSAVTALVLAEIAPAAEIQVDAAVLISPMAQLRPAVDAIGRRFGISYPWGPASLPIADRLDFVARAGEIAEGEAAVRLIVGADDDQEGFIAPAHRLADALRIHHQEPSRIDLQVLPGMAHALAEEPGTEAAPQTAAAIITDALTSAWLQQHL